MCLCIAVTFSACSSEHSVKTETKVSVSTSSDLQKLLDKANDNYNAGNYDEALKNFNEAIELDKDSIEAYAGRGAVYYSKKTNCSMTIKLL